MYEIVNSAHALVTICMCWFHLIFNVKKSHLISACDHYNPTLKGYTKPRIFVYNQKRGRKPKTIAISATAFASNPMPILRLPKTFDEESSSSETTNQNTSEKKAR